MTPDTPIEISPTDVSYLLGRPGPRTCRIIDCREESEWQVCRLPEAQLVPLSRFGELAPQAFPNTQEHLIIYCHHGMRSLRAAQWLREYGFIHAQSMRGGIDAWADLVDPEMPRY
ncbi:MAG: rhodanese [Prosthecobacter sp.]|jgi:rhodanese-related sulfurtransferase|uniref:rhodanese-like domain-containing protein n=1 Tax=Prosthecobacter sp. TaxID=1965333 RepID=UPI0019E60F0B|nr:rhodanese-like domain-containing protein [Prosthecobacter sp.]MBE2283437.1 rhodanese [Prosthecobacter sp.]